MQIEFKTHQMVVAGMQTQIDLLNRRCSEWQQWLKSAEDQARVLRGLRALDATGLSGMKEAVSVLTEKNARLAACLNDCIMVTDDFPVSQLKHADCPAVAAVLALRVRKRKK